MIKSIVLAAAICLVSVSSFAAETPATTDAPTTFALAAMTLEDCQSVKGFGPKTCEKVIGAREDGSLTECTGAAVVKGVGKVKAKTFSASCTD